MELVGGEPEPKRRRVEVSPPECYFCLETIFPCERIHQSWCRPVPHVTHRRCWSVTENLVCGLCRQEEPHWSEVMLAVEASGDKADLDKEYQPEELTPLGRALLDLRSKGKVTYREMWEFAKVCRKMAGTWP